MTIIQKLLGSFGCKNKNKNKAGRYSLIHPLFCRSTISDATAAGLSLSITSTKRTHMEDIF